MKNLGIKAGLALTLALLIGPVFTTASDAAPGGVRNGEFGQRESYQADDAQVQAWQKAGWQVPEDLVLPLWWTPNAGTHNGVLDYQAQGGWRGGPFVRLDKGGHIMSYFGGVTSNTVYVATIRARGPGHVTFGCYEYADGLQKASTAFISRDLTGENWVEYRARYECNRDDVTSINLYLAGQGPVDIDRVTLVPAGPAEAEIAREMARLYGKGVLIEDLDTEAVQVDDAYLAHKAAYDKAVALFTAHREAVDPATAASHDEKIKGLAIYLEGEDKHAVGSVQYNEMVALTRVLQRLTKQEQATVTVSPSPVASSGADGYKIGERAARPDAVTITDIRSNKVRYDENERAVTTATVVNTTDDAVSGTLVAVMHLDVATEREIKRQPFTVQAGATRTWEFKYNVGPETYGRGVEVRFETADGQVLDTWQEYYAVAAEWLRVMQQPLYGTTKSYRSDAWTTYGTHIHYFGSEPTSWGPQAKEAAEIEEYLSGIAQYHLNMKARRARIASSLRQGVTSTFYQGPWFDGQMGYEVMRKHPEFMLYDDNGQPAVDPVYGNYPNPMELASPIEIGPKRHVTKPYLDRKITSWMHGPPNFANEDAVRYFAECVAEYGEFLGASGVYVDGNVGVWAGRGYDGKRVAPNEDPEVYAELNARSHALYSQIVKAKNPNFGTWYNGWSDESLKYFLRKGVTTCIGSGSGLPGDPNDHAIRAAAGWSNVMFLSEEQFALTHGDGPNRFPGQMLTNLCDNRDYQVQRFGANAIMGYIANFSISHDKPGPDRWGWATHNWFCAQFIATQYHFTTWFVPSLRPTLQFMTRYSRLIWARDIKTVPDAEQFVRVDSPEALPWQRVVYRRDTPEGYDLIVHLVRLPPSEKWDLAWLDEPEPLPDVRVSLTDMPGTLKSVYALRPYYFEEAQQPVQTALTPTGAGDEVSIAVPPFRYYTMVVFRMEK